ncbi:hypothetical protein [Syntrophomonas palmitatica]|uniref:hypothetical protein n=1 Tax=Syntrophomonas palmitatica TaxID=402877 RepID=UPI0006D08163|nr:hypothetical protein [Syntrophomonas palmitatica]
MAVVSPSQNLALAIQGLELIEQLLQGVVDKMGRMDEETKKRFLKNYPFLYHPQQAKEPLSVWIDDVKALL